MRASKVDQYQWGQLTEPRLSFMFSFDTDAPSSRVQERES